MLLFRIESEKNVLNPTHIGRTIIQRNLETRHHVDVCMKIFMSMSQCNFTLETKIYESDHMHFGDKTSLSQRCSQDQDVFILEYLILICAEKIMTSLICSISRCNLTTYMSICMNKIMPHFLYLAT